MKEMIINIENLTEEEALEELVLFVKSITEEDDIPDGYCDIVASYEQYLEEFYDDQNDPDCSWIDETDKPMDYDEFRNTKLEHYMCPCPTLDYIQSLAMHINIEDLCEVLIKQNIDVYVTYESVIVINTIKGSVVIS